MKFITIPKDGLGVWEFTDLLNEKEISFDEKFVLSIRKGRGKKLRKATAQGGMGDCECCGAYQTLRITIGEKNHYFDSHLGVNYISPDRLL
jgi:hypothetical protein